MLAPRLLLIVRASYMASRGVCRARRAFGDLREAGEICGLHRVERLMRRNKIKAIRGYKSPRALAGRPSIIASNHLQRAFSIDAPNTAWVTNITYIRTWQGWCVWRWWLTCMPARSWPDKRVIVHSDQGSQYGSDDFRRFCQCHNLEPSMSRRGDCLSSPHTKIDMIENEVRRS